MIASDLISLAREISGKHGVPPEVVCGLIERESTGSRWAVRFEPGFLKQYVLPQYGDGKLDATETYTRAMSFGPMQILGQVAREFGFEGKYLTQLCDPLVGIEFGCRKLAACLKKANGDINRALESWNGGSNPNYSGEVLMLSIPYRTLPEVKTV